MNEGWVCPKCGRVFAPWVSQCSYCEPFLPGSTKEPNYCPLPTPSTGDCLPPPQYTKCENYDLKG
jgi:hypothetical protein